MGEQLIQWKQGRVGREQSQRWLSVSWESIMVMTGRWERGRIWQTLTQHNIRMDYFHDKSDDEEDEYLLSISVINVPQCACACFETHRLENVYWEANDTNRHSSEDRKINFHIETVLSVDCRRGQRRPGLMIGGGSETIKNISCSPSLHTAYWSNPPLSHWVTVGQ